MITGFTYLNREFDGNVPYTERFRSICFRPLHYFFEGKTYVLPEWDGDKWEVSESYPADQHNGLNTLKMAVLIIPATAVGIVLSIIAWIRMQFWYSNSYNNLWTKLAALEETPFFQKNDTFFELPNVQLPENYSPKKSHDALSERWINFIGKLQSKENWKDMTIRAECGQLIEDAYVDMVLLLKHAAKTAKDNPAEMANLMFDLNRVGDNYCLFFFYNSIGRMYFAAKLSLSFKKNQRNGFDYIMPGSNQLTWKESGPFFTQGTPEYRWRRLYNAACALIDQYPGLREALDKKDHRFSTCAKPDYTPSNWPSSWSDRPHY